jgi:hypothetical protein
MVNEQIIKEEIQKLTEIPGKVRGQVFITDLEYVKEKKGQEGAELLKKRMEELGNPIDYGKIKTFDWYPVGLRAVSLLVIQEVFGWGDKEISEMGNLAPKYSFIVRLIMGHLLSIAKVFQESPKYWKKHYTVGKLETVKLDEKEKYLILHLKDFKVHPILCTYLFEDGYFLRIGQYVLENPKITSRETKCMFRGDSHHECLIKWE